MNSDTGSGVLQHPPAINMLNINNQRRCTTYVLLQDRGILLKVYVQCPTTLRYGDCGQFNVYPENIRKINDGIV